MGCPKSFSVKGGMGAALLDKPEVGHASTLKQNDLKNLQRKLDRTRTWRWIGRKYLNVFYMNVFFYIYTSVCVCVHHRCRKIEFNRMMFTYMFTIKLYNWVVVSFCLCLTYLVK